MIYFYTIAAEGEIYLTRYLVAKLRRANHENALLCAAEVIRGIMSESSLYCITQNTWSLGNGRNTFKRVLTLHPDYDTIARELAERVPDVRDLIVKRGYPALPLQDGALPFGHANLLTARKAFKYRKQPIWYGSGRVIGVERRGPDPVVTPLRYAGDA